jgi:heme/copper-type cytochrome/quinol oxidase subunit 2
MKHLTLIFVLILLFCFSACISNNKQDVIMAHDTSISATGTAIPTMAHAISTIGFTATGGLDGAYTLRTSHTISMLRHGHKEFTIDVVDGTKTVFLVFYGYSGPGSYRLSNPLNGGEAHISFGTPQTTWDLTATPGAACALNVISDQPGQYPGIDSMRGTFACPHLDPVSSNQHIAPLSISKGYFNILIQVQS